MILLCTTAEAARVDEARVQLEAEEAAATAATASVLGRYGWVGGWVAVLCYRRFDSDERIPHRYHPFFLIHARRTEEDMAGMALAAAAAPAIAAAAANPSSFSSPSDPTLPTPTATAAVGPVGAAAGVVSSVERLVCGRHFAVAFGPSTHRLT